MRGIKLAVLFLVVGCFLTTLSAPSALATDWYFTMSAGGDWDQAYNWADPDGNQPPGGEPGENDSAFLVVPYWYNDYPNYVQPVQVFYRSDTSPLLNQVVVESGNVLMQWQRSDGLPTDDQLNLRSNTERVGGSGLTFDIPPSDFGGTEVLPIGSHMQNAGTNSTGFLLVGGTEGSEGDYRLEGTGILSVGESEYLGEAGTGRFEQNGGEHWVGTALFMGYEATGDGTYRMTDGSLTVAGGESVGTAGTGLFDHRVGGTNSTGQLFIGQDATGSGTYILGGLSELNVSGTTTIGNHGQGTFEQSAGTHTAGKLVLGSEVDGVGTYELRGGTLEVTGETQVGGMGEGIFTQIGGTHNTRNLSVTSQSSGSGSYSIGATGTLNVADTLVVGERGAATFVQNGGTANVGTVSQPGELNIGDAGGTGEYTLNDGLLNVLGSSKIWRNSTFKQTGGEYRGDLLTTMKNATHTMEGGTLIADEWNVDGNVTQTSGDATIETSFTVGRFVNPEPGRYLLEATDSNPSPRLTVNGTAVIGFQSVGEFTQRGADTRATINQLTVGGGIAKGDYFLEEGGTLSVLDKEIIGLTSAGKVTQTGLSYHYVSGDHVVGDQASGTYELQGSTLDNKGDLVIGRLATGTFNNSGSIHNIDGDLKLGTESYINPDLSGGYGDGHYTLNNFGLVQVVGSVVIGEVYGDVVDGAYLGYGDFKQYSGGLTIGKDLQLSSGGTLLSVSSFELKGGFVRVAGDLRMGTRSQYNLYNDAELDVKGHETIFGHFTQENGTHTAHENVYVGGSGSYTQNDGDFLIDGNLTSSGLYSMYDGKLESATHEAYNFVQSAGEHIVSGEMEVGGTATIRGTGSLTAGNINIEGTFNLGGGAFVSAAGGIYNQNNFNLTGIASRKTIDAELTNEVGATTNISEAFADFRQSVDNQAATIFGKGTVSIDRSVVDFRGSFTNNGVDKECGDFGGCFDAQYAQVLIEESIVNFHESFWNEGLVVLLNSTARFLGGYGGGGALYSDPSDIYFSNATFLEGGTIQAGPGDQFFVEGDFVNGSLENTLWDTSEASLIFNGSGVQNFYLAGVDMGATALGFEDNFAWGELILGSGVSLNLLDGNDVAGAALYIGQLGFEDPIVDLYDLIFGSFMSDFNVYYNSSLAGNSFLGGMSYALGGSGFLLPTFFDTPPTEPVPEPSTFVLLGCGLVGLVFMARRKRKEHSS